MDIAKFFDVKPSKKRVFSSEQSEAGDMPKKQKEGSRNESSTSTLDDVFAESLKNLDCVLILANELCSLEQQVKEPFDLAKKSNESQIKGKLALQDVRGATKSYWKIIFVSTTKIGQITTNILNCYFSS